MIHRSSKINLSLHLETTRHLNHMFGLEFWVDVAVGSLRPRYAPYLEKLIVLIQGPASKLMDEHFRKVKHVTKADWK